MDKKSVNKVILIGNIGNIPESRYTASGVAVTSFSLATNETWVNADNEKVNNTEWHNIVVWNKLAEFAFSDKKYQQILNQIMWPNVHTLIESATEKATKNNIDLFVVDAALLFEAEYTDFFDSILLITAPISLRIKRILNRDDISIQQIKSRMDLQMLDPEKKELANYTIENNRDLDHFYNNLENYYRSIILK